MAAGFFGLFDFTGFPAGVGVGRRHSAFRGAGRHTHRVLLQLMMQEARRLRERPPVLAPEVLAELLARAKRLDVDDFRRRREAKAAAWALVLCEV